MALQLGWRPTTVPTVPRSSPARAGDRRDLALEITGNDAAVTDGAQGRVKIVEVAGSGATRGASEPAGERLICTFHGTWHRSGTGRSTAMTLELFLPSGHMVSAETWQLHGYDPECIPGLGVDGFALTFLSRVFPVNFPFFLDSATEGRFVELQAVAEWDSGGAATEIARSPVLNIPIRRNHAVTSTTGSMVYTDNLVGNVVLHHESYLLQGARIAHGASWPSGTLTASYFTIAPSTAGGFANHGALPADQKLGIFIQPVVADEILPDATDSIWTSAPLSTLGGAALRTTLVARVRQAILDTLNEVFVTDAGFTGGRAAFLDAVPAGDAAIAATLGRTGTRTVPFFTFLVERNNGLSEVAHAEEIESSTTTTLSGFDWLLPSAFPLGSGTKQMNRGIQFRSRYFSEHFADFVSHPRRRGQPPLTAADVTTAAEKQGAKLAETIAHEVAHSLGMMHESEVENGGGNFEEAGVGPLRSIMCSQTDSQPYGAGVRFSNQAKVIWRDAFHTSPRLATDSLRNKTWTAAEVRTVDWTDRIGRVIAAIGETSIARHPPDIGQVSPYTTMPSPQPGTYVRPPASP